MKIHACTLLVALSIGCQRADQPAGAAPDPGSSPQPVSRPISQPVAPPVADRDRPASPVMVDPPPPYGDDGQPIFSAPPPREPKQRQSAGPVDCFAPVIKTAVNQWISNLRATDLDGDGELDVILLYDRMLPDNQFRSMLEILRGDGQGGFRSVQAIEVGETVLDVATADFDEDGRVDLAFTDFKAGKLLVYRNRGDAKFAPATEVATRRRASELRAADFDRDGHQDVVIAVEKGLVQVFRGDGTGKLTHASDTRVEAAPDRPAVADLDGDGILDLAILNNDDNTAMALLGKGDGSFTRASRVSVCDSPTSLATGDFDRDGAVDLAFACLRDRDLHVLLNRDHATKWRAQRIAGDLVDRIGVGDLDRDGLLDIVSFAQIRHEQLPAGYRLGGKVILFSGDGKGGFTQRAAAIEGGHLGTPVIADLDHDGTNDLVASLWEGRRPGFVAVWLGRSCD